MRRGLNILAIIVLLITIAAAGAVLYGIRTLTPQVVSVTASVTPANQAKETFDAIAGQIDAGLFGGRVFEEISESEAESCSFVTYTVRLKNNGFFPAEWISLDVTPLKSDTGSDMLQLENGGANVLYAGAQGDLAVTLLTTLNPPQQERTIEIASYVFGRKQIVRVQTN